MKDYKVKECPFCGADEGFLTIMVEDMHVCYVKCCNCGGRSGICETSDEAVDAWNQREGEPDYLYKILGDE